MLTEGRVASREVMAEILKDTGQRLVILFGTRGRRWSKLTLDKDAGFAWYERHAPFWPDRTDQVPLAEISALDLPGGGRSEAAIILKSGQRFRLAGTADATPALERARDFLPSGESGSTIAAAPSPAAPSPAAQSLAAPRRAARRRALRLVAAGVIAIVALALAASLLLDRVILPSCDSARTRDTLHDLLQRRAKSTVRLSDFAEVSRDAKERRCQARLTVDGDTAIVGYRSSWDGWTQMLRVTGPVGSTHLNPKRLVAIDAAYDRFMTLAREAYSSGNPPRQFDPDIYKLLTTMFDLAGLTAGTLAGSDIDEAIRWFNAGDTVGQVYLLAGTGVSDVASLPAGDAIQRQLRNNIVSFSDEYGRYLDFEVTLLAQIAHAQASYSVTGPTAEVDNPSFRSKMAAIKPLLAQALMSDFISLVYEGLSDNWRMDRLAALARTAPIAVKVLSKDELAAVRDQARLTLPYFARETTRARARAVADLFAKP